MYFPVALLAATEEQDDSIEQGASKERRCIWKMTKKQVLRVLTILSTFPTIFLFKYDILKIASGTAPRQKYFKSTSDSSSDAK